MSVEAEARAILSSVRAMVADHRVTRGVGYVDEGGLPTLKRAPLCNGFQACAIGALYLSAGVKTKRDSWGSIILPGTDNSHRYVGRHRNRALRLAYAALNEAAVRAMTRIGSDYIEDGSGGGFVSAIERYFELERPSDEDMLKCVDSARRSIKVPA